MSEIASVMPTLELVRDTLATVAGVRTSRIGLEPNMVAEDYPMARVVPSRIVEAQVLGERGVECLIYFGLDQHAVQIGFEELQSQLLAMEATILTTLFTAPGFFVKYEDTTLDEDRIPGFKLLALRVTIEA